MPMNHWRWPSIIGPVFSVDIIRSSRQTRHFIIRSLYVAFVLTVFWWFFARLEVPSVVGGIGTANGKFMAAIGALFFETFSIVHLTIAIIMAASLLGGAISDERQRKTLDFMLVTDLSTREIILGKFIARTVLVGSLLVAPLPILMSAILLGGISSHSVLQLGVLSICILFGFGGVAVYISTVSEQPKNSVTWTFLLFVALLCIPSLVILLQQMLGLTNWRFELMHWLLSINPYKYLSIQRLWGPEAAWDNLATVVIPYLIAGSVFSFLAIWRLRSLVIISHDRNVRSRIPKSRSILFGRPELGRWPPVVWREIFCEPSVRVRGRIRIWLGRIVFVGLHFIILWMFIQSIFTKPDVPRRLFENAFATGVIFISLTLSIAVIFLTGIKAATTITSEKESDTWTTLISGPNEGSGILFGKLAGAVAGFRVLLLPYCFAWLLVAFVSPSDFFRGPLMLFTTVILSAFNSAVGILISLTSKTSRGATTKTLLFLILMSGGYLILSIPLIPVINASVLGLSQIFLINATAFVQFNVGGVYKEMVSTFYVGLGLYILALWVLVANLAACFDELAGRGVITFEQSEQVALGLQAANPLAPSSAEGSAKT